MGLGRAELGSPGGAIGALMLIKVIGICMWMGAMGRERRWDSDARSWGALGA